MPRPHKITKDPEIKPSDIHHALPDKALMQQFVEVCDEMIMYADDAAHGSHTRLLFEYDGNHFVFHYRYRNDVGVLFRVRGKGIRDKEVELWEICRHRIGPGKKVDIKSMKPLLRPARLYGPFE